ncbi:hypothetical protein JCM3775_000986 [Rhodotorula graminis]
MTALAPLRACASVHRCTVRAHALVTSTPTRCRRSSTSPAPPRTYLYDVDWNGQLYLSDSKHRNVATAFRDARFLDTFWTRLRRNDTDDEGQAEARRLRAGGYEFVSPCQGEMNYLRPDPAGSGLVFQALEDGELRYADSLSLPFDPQALRVDAATGYLFHPSPAGSRRRRDAPSRYGPYSLLRSSLVIEHFAKSLELDEEGGGGTFEYEGEAYRIEPLQDGDVWRRQDL